MSGIDKHPAGTFSWVEIGTTDATRAKAFYQGLFAWECTDSPMDGGGSYTILTKNGKQVGGLYGLGPEQRQRGVPSHWLSYVAVESADAALQKATTLGGKLLCGPCDVMEHGRMAVLEDPTGACFAVWQPMKHVGSEIVNEPGAICWIELGTRDTRRAGQFYRDLFGWSAQTQDLGGTPYTMFQSGTQATAGMWTLPTEMAGVPPHWLPYFAVADCEQAAARAHDLGGTVIAPPSDVPGIGRFAVLQDPTGAVFAVIKLLQAC